MVLACCKPVFRSQHGVHLCKFLNNLNRLPRTFFVQIRVFFPEGIGTCHYHWHSKLKHHEKNDVLNIIFPIFVVVVVFCFYITALRNALKEASRFPTANARTRHT